MEQPPGFVDTEFPHFVCKLLKSIYGLRQASRTWFDTLSQFLLNLGFNCSKADSSLFVFCNNSITIILLVYVDDIVITGNNVTKIQYMIDALGQEFAIKDLGQLNFFLGMEVKYNANGVTLSQSKYANELITRANLQNCSTIATPMATKTQSSCQDLEPFDATIYRSLAGGLLYLTHSRPDITHAVHKICQKVQHPTNGDFKAVKRILRYVKGTIDFGIHFSTQSSLKLYGFCDADWA